METYVIEYLDYLQEWKGRAKNTLSSYEQDLYQFLRFLQKNDIYRLEKVTETNCNSYLLRMEQEGMKPASITRKLAVLRGFFDFCIRKGYVKENPTERLKPAKIIKEAPEVLTQAEIKRLLAVPDLNTRKGKRDRAILELLYGTGIQAAELTLLKRGALNRNLGFLRIEGEGQERVVPVPAESIPLLVEYLDADEKQQKDKPAVEKCKPEAEKCGPGAEKCGPGAEGFFFPARNGGGMTRQAIWKIVKDCGEKAGLEKVSPQILRNSFAAHLLQSGENFLTVQQRLGISEPSMIGRLQVYSGK